MINIKYQKSHSIWKNKSNTVYSQKNQITTEIYIGQVLLFLAVLFYEKCLKKMKKIIYISDKVAYHLSKYVNRFWTKIDLLYMIWLK